MDPQKILNLVKKEAMPKKVRQGAQGLLKGLIKFLKFSVGEKREFITHSTAEQLY